MDWPQFAIMFITFVGLFIWNRTENRADMRHMDAKLESNRNLSIQIHKENQDVINGIREDIKDFHGRLEKIDAEFKAHLLYHNEINKRKS